MPGILTSRIRHLVWPTHSDTKNSSADEKAWTAKPNTLSRLGSESRTDSSSSTTDTRSPVGTKNTPFALHSCGHASSLNPASRMRYSRHEHIRYVGIGHGAQPFLAFRR